MDPVQAIIGVAGPALICGLLLLPVARPWLRGARGQAAVPPVLATTPGIAIAAGFAAGYVSILGWPPLAPAAADQWLIHIGFGAAIIGIFETLYRDASWVIRVAVRWTASAAMVWLLAQSRIEYAWSGSESVIIVIGLGAALTAGWSVIDRARHEVQGAAVPLALLALTAGAAGTLVVSGTASMGQTAGALAAALGAVMVGAWLFPQRMPLVSVLPVAVLLLGAHWLVAYFYASMPTATLALLLVAPVMILVGALATRRSQSGLIRALALAIAVTIPVAAAGGFAASVYFADATPAYAPSSAGDTGGDDADGDYGYDSDSEDSEDSDYGY